MLQGPDVAPGHVVRPVAEVVVAQRLEHVDLVVDLLHREFPGETATKGELSAAISPLLPAVATAAAPCADPGSEVLVRSDPHLTPVLPLHCSSTTQTPPEFRQMMAECRKVAAAVGLKV